MIRLSARGASALWEPSSGHLPELRIGGAQVLLAAPWRDDPTIQRDMGIPKVDRRLGGTFICAPFGRDDADQGPPHGAVAQGPWTVLRRSPSTLVAQMHFARGTVRAQLALRDDHPALYQTHVLDLTAPCSFGHHPMISVAAGGRLSGPPPKAVLTFEAEAPVYPSRFRAEGWILTGPEGPRDIRDIPTEVCEDFATIVSDAKGVGWTTLSRRAEGDTIVILRRADQLPVTNLWLSNGARREAPWHGQLRGCVGVEDAICAGAEGTRAALAGKGRVAAEGVPTALPAGRHVIPHAILRLPGCREVTDLHLEGDQVRLETDIGPLHLPFDGGHFQ